MNFEGILVGAAVFLIIGICHPIVIKMEYYWGKRSWWVLALAGTLFCIASVYMESLVGATILGSAGFSCYWGIHELLAQEFRVLRGWFPENPARAEYYKRQREKYPDLTPTPSHKNLCRKRK